MNYSIFRFTLNMHNHRSQASVSAFQGDTAVRLLINITDGGVPYTIGDGCVAMLTGTKADGTKFAHRCAILNSTTIQYDFTEQTASCVGVTNCEVALYGADGGIITAPKFIMVVDEREVNGDAFPLSEDEQTLLATIAVAEAERIEAESARAKAETIRAEAESERVTSEDARAEAELARASAEAVRAEAEMTRAEAETARATAMIKAVSDVNTAINNTVDKETFDSRMGEFTILLEALHEGGIE